MNLKSDLIQDIQLVGFDFDGVFTDNTVYVNQDGSESVRCWRSDGIGLARLRSLGVKIFIISSEVNPILSARALKLDLPYKQGVECKATAIIAICKELKINPQQTMFVGNDVNDIPAFKSVGFPVGVADSHPEIESFINYRTNNPGGYGAVREICDLICYTKQFKNEKQ